METWLCGVRARLHGQPGGSANTSSGGCMHVEGSAAAAMHAVSTNTLVEFALAASLGVLCAVGLLVWVRVLLARARAESDGYRRALARYQAEARTADAEEVSAILVSEPQRASKNMVSEALGDAAADIQGEGVELHGACALT